MATLLHVVVGVIVGLLVATSARAQGERPVVAAAGWCAIADDDTEQKDGCDIGLAVALMQRGHLAWVAVLGSHQTGSGLAWVVNPEAKTTPVVAVAVGVVVAYDEAGLSRHPRLALGATLSLGRRRNP